MLEENNSDPRSVDDIRTKRISLGKFSQVINIPQQKE